MTLLLTLNGVANAGTGVLAAASQEIAQNEGATVHWLIIILMMTGIYMILSKSNMVKSIIGLNLFQAGVIMFYVSMGRVDGGTAPILLPADQAHAEHVPEGASSTVAVSTAAGLAVGSAQRIAKAGANASPVLKSASGSQSGHSVPYSNPLPHVLMLTAIVVGVATTALALALVVRINEYYGTIEEDELELKEVG